MTPALLMPAGLAALAALIVPMVIHIARRSEQLPTDFAALRWLRQKPRPRSRLRFDEWPLLLARLLLLTLVALWFARPVLFGAAETSAYFAVIPGADVTPLEASSAKGARTHWLAPGFPELKSTNPASGRATPVSIASLIRQLDADLPAGAHLTIVAPRVMEGADAERPRLSRPVDWRVVPGTIASRPALPIAARPVSIRADAAHSPGLRYLRAAALAWQPAGQTADVDVGAIDSPLPATSRRLVWLAAGTLPTAVIRWIEAGGTAIVAADAELPPGSTPVVIWRDDVGRPLIQAQPLGAGRLMQFTRPLLPSQMPELLDAAFPGRLRALFDATLIAPTRVQAADYGPTVGGRGYDPAPLDIRPWLAVLIGLVLLAERWLATRQGRGIRP